MVAFLSKLSLGDPWLWSFWDNIGHAACSCHITWSQRRLAVGWMTESHEESWDSWSPNSPRSNCNMSLFCSISADQFCWPGCAFGTLTSCASCILLSLALNWTSQPCLCLWGQWSICWCDQQWQHLWIQILHPWSWQSEGRLVQGSSRVVHSTKCLGIWDRYTIEQRGR